MHTVLHVSHIPHSALYTPFGYRFPHGPFRILPAHCYRYTVCLSDLCLIRHFDTILPHKSALRCCKMATNEHFLLASNLLSHSTQHTQNSAHFSRYDPNWPMTACTAPKQSTNTKTTHGDRILLLVTSITRVGLCESSFLLLEYSIEYLIEYSNTDWYRMWRTYCKWQLTTNQRNEIALHYGKSWLSWSLNSMASLACHNFDRKRMCSENIAKNRPKCCNVAKIC